MLMVQKDLGEILLELRLSYSDFNYLYLAIAIVMVIPNWLIESYKWGSGMNSYNATISHGDAIISVLSGVTLGIITPARVGEYAGRMILVGKEKYAQSLIVTFLCSISQLLVTLIIGGVTFMLSYKSFEFEGFSYDLIVYLGLGVFAVLFCAYLNLAQVISLFEKVEWLKNKMKGLSGIENNFGLQIKLLLLAAGRYLVYTLQYILVLRFCGVAVASWLLFSHITMIFFLQSLMPLPPFASFFARTGIALVILASLNINELVNVMSSMILWIINLSLPALAGLYFIIVGKSVRA